MAHMSIELAAALCDALIRTRSCWVSMKFGALLRDSAEGTPELQSLFQCYKHLKKRLKRLPERQNVDHPTDDAALSEDEMAQRTRNFVMMLNDDVNQ